MVQQKADAERNCGICHVENGPVNNAGIEKIDNVAKSHPVQKIADGAAQSERKGCTDGKIDTPYLAVREEEREYCHRGEACENDIAVWQQSPGASRIMGER